jgi:chitodextrinase
MSRMKTSLLLAVITVVFSGCSGVQEAQTSNGAGTPPAVPAADTTPPSPPAGLTAAAAGSTGANVSWSASTDNVGATGYIVRRNGVQVATPASTSFADTGLSAATTYSYTVAARDAAGNVSPDSTSVSVTTASTADTTPPSTPTGLTGAAAGSTGANLSWSASTDNVGVSGYILRRNGVQVATPASTSSADTGLSPATTYSYTVAARDAAGNLSPDSTSVSVTTANAADATPPSTPNGLTAAPAGSTGASLSWSSSTDNVGVTGYILRRNGVQVATPVSTSFADTGLSSATTYSYTVAARDAAGNMSPNSASASVTTADSTPPSRPTGLTGAAAGSSGASLSWSASTDNVGVTGYIVRRNGVQVATPVSTSFADTGLSAATTYSYTVAARDAAGNISLNSASVSVTTVDTTPPSTPTGLTGAAAGSTGASLSWSASTDNVGVTGYIVRRNGVQVATPVSTSYADTGLSPATTYSYSVAARDAAGNISPNSAGASVTTENTPPPPPSNSASLVWDAVTAPNLSGYRLYYGNAPRTYLQSPGQGISVGNVTAFTLTGLANGTRYYFAVTDFDTLGHESLYSNEVFTDIP